MSDPLGEQGWWVHEIQVRRYVSGGFDGPGLASPETFMGWVQDGTKIVADGTGGQVASSARVACSLAVAYIPVGSEVTLPDEFAAPGQARVTKVIGVERGDGVTQPTPNHLTLNLL